MCLDKGQSPLGHFPVAADHHDLILRPFARFEPALCRRVLHCAFRLGASCEDLLAEQGEVDARDQCERDDEYPILEIRQPAAIRCRPRIVAIQTCRRSRLRLSTRVN
jgi:hypothetical protein